VKDIITSPDALMSVEVTPKDQVQVIIVPGALNAEGEQERIIMYFPKDRFVAWLYNVRTKLRISA
jgi:hypothetical protein